MGSEHFNCNLHPSKELNVLNINTALTEKSHIAIIFSAKNLTATGTLWFAI